MVKLNYVNRKISGVKLAQSVQRDIQKRIPKIGEERKLAAVQRDPVVEIDISGRQLGLEGFAIVCDSIYNMGLIKLSRVEELNLSGNDLTAECLPHLRRALSVCSDLHSLDISHNHINISTIKEMEDWKSFLTVFSDLKCVRRLDFSNNPLGDLAIEIMFCVYAVEKEIFIPYDFSALKETEAVEEATEANYSVEGFDIRSQGGHLYLAPHPEDNTTESATHLGKVSSTTIASQASGLLSSSPTSSVDPSRDPAEIHGLRAIPYIVMSSIGITDLGAMWMSFVIPEHPLPSELLPHLPPLKEGPLAATLRKYDALLDFRGIILTENSDITAVGQRVLKEAEDRRDQDAARVEELITHGRGRRRSSTLSDSGFEDPGRRDPNRRTSGQDDSFHFSSTSRKALNEYRYGLDRSRARIQLNALRDKGVEASLLWKVVMRMVVVGRAILLDYSGPLMIDGYEPSITFEVKQSQRSSVDSSFKAAQTSAQSSPSSQEALSGSLAGLTLKKKDKVRLPGKLPINLWMKIICMAEDGDNLTTRTQRLNIFHWVRSRASIRNELEYVSESTETQTRRVLGKVKGLAYEL
ncbi:hypothetical protein TWF694_010562 [Orbilia ellipsospora]|uniref:Leucine rich repeat protein n=1 Tax=Orbilia ellipsospora TaxID=2528407 RepID=A0AAV9XB63_9PEZI